MLLAVVFRRDICSAHKISVAFAGISPGNPLCSHKLVNHTRKQVNIRAIARWLHDDKHNLVLTLNHMPCCYINVSRSSHKFDELWLTLVWSEPLALPLSFEEHPDPNLLHNLEDWV